MLLESFQQPLVTLQGGITKHWYYSASLAALILPGIYSFKQLQRSIAVSSETGIGDDDSASAQEQALTPNRSKIQMLQRLGMSASGMAVLVFLIDKYYPKPVDNEGNILHVFDKRLLTAPLPFKLHYVFYAITYCWKFKMLEMCYYGKDYFIQRNITTIGQTIADTLLPARFLFIDNNNSDNNNNNNNKDKNTKNKLAKSENSNSEAVFEREYVNYIKKILWHIEDYAAMTVLLRALKYYVEKKIVTAPIGEVLGFSGEKVLTCKMRDDVSFWVKPPLVGLLIMVALARNQNNLILAYAIGNAIYTGISYLNYKWKNKNGSGDDDDSDSEFKYAIPQMKFAYTFPLVSQNMTQFWQVWSVQIGEPLKSLIYLPMIKHNNLNNIFGIKFNKYFAMAVVFIVNGIDHLYLEYLFTFGNPNFDAMKTSIGLAKMFTILGAGTIFDRVLYKIEKAITKQTKSKRSNTDSDNNSRQWKKIAMWIIRYGMMWTTFYGTIHYGWDTGMQFTKMIEGSTYSF